MFHTKPLAYVAAVVMLIHVLELLIHAVKVLVAESTLWMCAKDMGMKLIGCVWGVLRDEAPASCEAYVTQLTTMTCSEMFFKIIRASKSPAYAAGGKV